MNIVNKNVIYKRHPDEIDRLFGGNSNEKAFKKSKKKRKRDQVQDEHTKQLKWFCGLSDEAKEICFMVGLAKRREISNQPPKKRRKI